MNFDIKNISCESDSNGDNTTSSNAKAIDKLQSLETIKNLLNKKGVIKKKCLTGIKIE